MDILFSLGMAMLAGLAGGKLLHNIGIPRVVGYILAGLVLGTSVTGLLSGDLLEIMNPVNQIALGFIGFMVGGELKAKVFRKYGTKFVVILICEGLLAALLVGVAVTALTGKPHLGLLLGALASATAPAATVNVLWEYRSKGPLTTTILAIVALDDGLGLLLYAFAVSLAEVLMGVGSIAGSNPWVGPLQEIFGSLVLGGVAGLLVNQLIRRLKGNSDQVLALLTGVILLICGISAKFELSQILANLVMGAVLANLLPQRKGEAFDTVKAFTPPIYILFFVFIGARLEIGLLPSLGLIGLVYLLCRTLGKVCGSYVGGWVSGAPPSVRKYLGWALFSQGGVAIGLALDISHRFAAHGPAGREVGGTVLNIIAATTVVVEILGPAAVKFALWRAGEIPLENGKGR